MPDKPKNFTRPDGNRRFKRTVERNQVAIQMPWEYTMRQESVESLDLEGAAVLKILISELEIVRIKKDIRRRFELR